MKRINSTYTIRLKGKNGYQKGIRLFRLRSSMLLLVAATLFATYSCDEEAFLDKKPHTPTDASFYTSESGAEQGINAAYDILQLGENYERAEFAGTVCSGDAMTGGEPGGNDQSFLQEMMKFSTAVTNPYCINLWNWMYRGVYRCNLVIYYISDPIEGFNEDLRKRILGEAYFLRGYFHFVLQRNYGGLPQMQNTFNNGLKGVPFIDHVLLQDEWNQVRPELNSTWERIEEDFIKAAELLPTQHDANNIGRATWGAAKAYLSKTYLYQEKWQQAYDAAKEVINSNQYYLIGENGHNDPLVVTRLGKNGTFEAQMPPYKWIWQPEANNCAESIFDIQHMQTGVSTFPEGMEGNLIPRYYGPRAVYAWSINATTKEHEFIEQEYFWGFILPTKYFMETAYKNIGCEENGVILDPRFKLTVVTADDKIPFYYADETLRASYPDSVNISPYFNHPATGCVTWKYFTDPIFNNVRGSLGDMPQNTKMFRFADLLLMGAEAALNLGNSSDALAWVNRVRERARNSGNTGYPKALTTLTKEDIWNERRVELAFEGHQFWDIVRTGRAQKILKEEALQYQYTECPKGQVQEQFGDAFEIGKHELWPIPAAEIANTNGSVTQNPGY
ncbi:MAG TPA: RagB/SusD family nutrient uptake outer membrane protein [Prolixibacteraceae bacterium]|nr:RagB/SusD family nutrient uptake outer membrane protein [Prolixibacteraceae bacterium]